MDISNMHTLRYLFAFATTSQPTAIIIDNMSKYEDEDWKDLSEDVKEAGECRFLEERVKA